ncbi:MAG: SRPBCC family protein [Myxococcota bacterium]|nr:SRPBCC family protein [Myxococcota bacterium]
MRLARWILGLLVFGTLWIPGAARAQEFTPEQRAALERGELVRLPLGPSAQGSGYVGGTSYVVVDAEPDLVWAAMIDVASYPRMFPRTLSAEVVSDRGSRRIVRMVQGTSWLAVSFYVLYRLDERARKVSWSLVEDQPHDLADTRGYWQVEPWAETRSLVTYVNVTSLGTGPVLALFHDAIQNGLLGVPGNLKAWIEGPNGARYREGAATATNR